MVFLKIWCILENLLDIEVSEPLAIVAHDAGGAEVLSSYVARHCSSCMFVLEGPALDIFERKLGVITLTPLEEAVDTCNSLLCGTSSKSALEWRAIAAAQAVGKPAVAFLDHWVNYRQRFTRFGQWHWPDEVWVGDETAARIARKDLPELKQRLVPNAYFMDIRDEMDAVVVPPRAPDAGLNILYVCEPLREGALARYGDERYWGYTEEEALAYFLSNIAVLGNNIARITIRVHPTENQNKYDCVQGQFDLPFVLGEQRTLLEQIAVSDVVVGRSTMAMVVGLLSGKRVFSCIPPGGKTPRLPQVEIENMSDLILASQTDGGPKRC
jgi:hypothetical protein